MSRPVYIRRSPHFVPRAACHATAGLPFSSQVPAFTIFTPKKISSSILPSFSVPSSAVRNSPKTPEIPHIPLNSTYAVPPKPTQVPAITNSNHLTGFTASVLCPNRILHFRRKYLISSFFSVEMRTACS